MVYSILVESYTNRSKRLHLCLGCWQLISISEDTFRRYGNKGFVETHYPLLLKISQVADKPTDTSLVEPDFDLNHLIYFLWYVKHPFLDQEAQKIFTMQENAETMTFMPFPVYSTELKRRGSAVQGKMV